LQEQLKARTRELAEAQRQADEARKHLAEAREQQTATSEVLRVISSSPGELEPVFNAMLANATRLCEASYGAMWVRDRDGLRATLHSTAFKVISRSTFDLPGATSGRSSIIRRL
jgi:DNA repair exonuclease SbcCD ATPase subunit